MYTLGVDIGSTTSKCVALEDGTGIAASSLVRGGIGTKGPSGAIEQIYISLGMSPGDMDAIVATGYGRNRFHEAGAQLSELTCHALGARFILPDVHTIIDIGGQDAKVISLHPDGRMKNFLMNDKCAAGTGRFLDVMANILQISISDLETYASRSKVPASISSTCTVFAESEVISQLACGLNIADIVAGICASVANRVAALVKRLGVTPAVCMSGGVALNAGVRVAMENAIGCPVLYSPKAQLFGAIGAAIYGYQTITSERKGG